MEDVKQREDNTKGGEININDTKIKFLNVADKIYQVTDISFFYMTIEATETDLTAADVPECELWNLEEFRNYKVRLINNDGKAEILDFGKWKKEKVKG